MNYKIHIENDERSKPREHELNAAKIIAEHFRSDIIFLKTYDSKTPDLFILKTNIRWELKSPEGNSKHTIKNNLREASHQSKNVILDLRRTKMTDTQGISRAKDYIKSEHSSIKRLKIIKKNKEVIDIIG